MWPIREDVISIQPSTYYAVHMYSYGKITSRDYLVER